MDAEEAEMRMATQYSHLRLAQGVRVRALDLDGVEPGAGRVSSDEGVTLFEINCPVEPRVLAPNTDFNMRNLDDEERALLAALDGDEGAYENLEEEFALLANEGLPAIEGENEVPGVPLRAEDPVELAPSKPLTQQFNRKVFANVRTELTPGGGQITYRTVHKLEKAAAESQFCEEISFSDEAPLSPHELSILHEQYLANRQEATSDDEPESYADSDESSSSALKLEYEASADCCLARAGEVPSSDDEPAETDHLAQEQEYCALAPKAVSSANIYSLIIAPDRLAVQPVKSKPKKPRSSSRRRRKAAVDSGVLKVSSSETPEERHQRKELLRAMKKQRHQHKQLVKEAEKSCRRLHLNNQKSKINSVVKSGFSAYKL